MILDRLQISGFLSYKERVEIDFSGFTLACISGQNGAGKSSLLEAITWALFGEARRKDDAVIHMAADTAEVILDFDYESGRYQVQRIKTKGKNTQLEFRIRDSEGNWIPLTEATMRATEDLIRRTLHLDYETFINASFFLQGKADLFAQQQPGNRKRILSGILGLDVWESYRDEASRRRKGLENELALVNSHLLEIEAELQEESERKQRLARLEKEVETRKDLFEARKVYLDQQRLIVERIRSDQRQVQRQRDEVQRLRVENDARIADLEIRLREREHHRTLLQQEAQIRQEVDAWEAARKALEEWEAMAVNFRQYDAQRQPPLQAIAVEETRLRGELENLQQKLTEVTSIEKDLPGLQQLVEDSARTVEDYSGKLATRAALEKEMRELQDEKARARAENTRMKAEMDEIVEHRAHLEQISGATCPTCEKPLSLDERQRLVDEINARGREKGNAYRENQRLMEQCDTRYRELETALAELQRVDAELKLQQRIYDAKSEELRVKQDFLADWQGRGAVRLAELSEILRSHLFAPEARAQLADVDARLKELGYDAAAHEQARRIEMEGRASQNRRLELEQARSALAPLEREITALQTNIKRNEERLAGLVDELKQAEEKLELESASLPDLSQLEKEYYDAQEQLNLALSDRGYTLNQVEVLGKQREMKKLKLEEKDSLNSRITDLKTLERAFGKDGIPALLIEQALPDIESHANEILDRLSSGSMSISFETQREFKDKKREDRRETLDILIRDPAGERPYELFSGGEAFRVNFAIRLALSRVLAHRAGARLQTLVIDEGFGSQDADGRQRLVEAINLVGAEFEKILVITHLEELKDAFPARIDVTKTPSGSMVEVMVA
ncbi:MAG TPA: SMC family ATPase [Anaerolineaceae bacterium]|nr:SMC family ATPase [Anaerolineaceae bacterium]